MNFFPTILNSSFLKYLLFFPGTTSTVAKKRKREPSPSLVCTPESIENILETNDASVNENNEVNEDDKVEVIYKSRFFKKAKTSPTKKQTGDWLEALEDTSPSKQFKYTPDVKDNDESEKVLRKAFKPVAMTLNSEVLVRKRNPFAVKMSEKKAKIEFSPIEVNFDQIKNSQDSNITSREKIKQQQVENDSLPEEPISEPEVKSQYFQANKKPRGMSGLLKSSSSTNKKKSNSLGNSGTRQPSLFDMWSKKA